MQDATEAISSAKSIDQPAGSTIYFAMDFDPAVYGAAGSEKQLLTSVQTYLTAVNQTSQGSGYSIGVYGAGDTLAAAIRNSPTSPNYNAAYTPVAVHGWLTQSYGWAGSNPQIDANAMGWDVYQGAQTTVNGVAIDPDTAENTTFGQWTLCLASGTLIRTTRGDVAVEDLAVGDLAVTASGAHRPIRWLGHRTMDCRNHPSPHEAMPVRIAAHSFGDNRPARDLRVSPGHSLCLDVLGEVLIPASALVNGSTITQETVDSVTYWHVELDGHDILLADNMPAESYLDMGNRSFFAEAGVVDLDAGPDAPVRTHADFCRPYHADGPLVAFVRERLAARSSALGWRLVEAPLGDLHLLVDGRRYEPETSGLAARFILPADAGAVWLVSNTGVPGLGDVNPDPRTLGVCVGRLVIDDGFGAPRTIMADDASLVAGFHDAEEGPRRWTKGRARLPASLWEGCRGSFFLRVDLALSALPRWVGPAVVHDANVVAIAG